MFRKRFYFSIYILFSIFLLPSCGKEWVNPFETGGDTTPAYSSTPGILEATPLPTSSSAITASTQFVSTIDVPPSALRGTIIHFWHTWSGPARDVLNSLIEDFNLNNEWGILVVPVAQTNSDQLSNNLVSELSADNSPDLVVGYPHQYLEWEETEGLVDLDPYVNDPNWGLTPIEQADFYPVIWEQDVLDGKRFGIPAQRSAQVLFYNETWARLLGFITPPNTPEQFMEQSCTSSSQETAIISEDYQRAFYTQQAEYSQQAEYLPQRLSTGGLIVSTNYAAMLGWIFSFDGEVIRSPQPVPGKSVYRFNTPQIEEAFTFLRGMYNQLCAWQSESQYPEEEFASGKGLFITGSVTDIPFLADAFVQADNPDRWTVIPFPSPTDHPAIDVYGTSFVVFPSTPQRQLAAWLLVKWLIEPSNQALIIEKTSGFPLRLSSLEHLEAFRSRYPQWTAALELLPLGRSEPFFRSWRSVRWALTDASTQLFRDYFTIDQAPVLVEYLDETAAELHLRFESSDVFSVRTVTPALTKSPTFRPIPSSTSTPTHTP